MISTGKWKVWTVAGDLDRARRDNYTGGMRTRNLHLMFAVLALVALAVACRGTGAPTPSESATDSASDRSHGRRNPSESATDSASDRSHGRRNPSESETDSASDRSHGRPSTAEALVLAYDDFGPQVMAHTLVGMEWWQWEAHGDSNPATTYPVRVVVHRGLGKAELAARYPVDPVKKLDHRYVTVERALGWLGENIAELEKDAASAKDAEDRALAAGLLGTLRGTRDRIRRHFGILGGG